MNATLDGSHLRIFFRRSHHARALRFCFLIWLILLSQGVDAQLPSPVDPLDPVTVGAARIMVLDVESQDAGTPAYRVGSETLISSGQTLTRDLLISNDASAGTRIEVIWTLHSNSPAGAVVDSGSLLAQVEPGRFIRESITFKPPEAPTSTSFFLILHANKNDEEVYRGTPHRFVTFNQSPLSGQSFGATPLFDSTSTHKAAIDGDPATYFDFAQPDGGFTGIDLGENKAKRVSSIIFTPRAGFERRMIGGRFEGSKDGAHYTPIYTIAVKPDSTTTVLVNSYEAYRFLRYAGPPQSHGNIAEMSFFTTNAAPLIGFAFGAMPPYTVGNEYDKATDGNPETFYDLLNASGGSTGIDLGAENAQRIGYLVFTPRPGFADRMAGGTFYGSNDGVHYTALHTIAAPPESAPNNTTVFLNTPMRYRFLKYAGGAHSNCNIAEMAFYRW